MTENAFTIRSLIIGFIFGSLVAMANAFLMLTIPVTITAAMISVLALFGYAALFRAPPPSSKEAVTALTVHKAAAFAFSIFPVVWVFLLSQDVPRAVGMGIPDWILPDPTLNADVLRNGVIFSRSWITPLAWMLPVAILSGVSALMVVIWLRNHFITEDLAFPEAKADIELIKSITTEKYRMNYLFYGLVLGFFFDFLLIHYPTSLGAAPDWLRSLSNQLALVDFTPYLINVLPGASLCIVISIGMLGLGMLMSPKSTFNMVGSAVAFYIILSAFLVSRGSIQAFALFSQQWPAFRFPYGLSISVGVLLTAALAPLVLKIASPLISGTRWKRMPPRNTVAVFALFCAAFLVLMMVLSMDRFVTVFPLHRSTALLAGIVILATFVAGIIVTIRIVGETGASWLAQFFDVTDYVRRGILGGLGVLGFEATAISESLQGTRFAAGQMEALKVGEAFDVRPRHQYLSALFGWCFAWLVTTPFVFLIWHFYGFGTGALPMPNMQVTASVIAALASGRMPSLFSNWFILIGFIIGIIVFFLQKRNLPFVAAAVGIGVFVGPIYVTTFFVGGLIRVIIEKLKGATWMDEKGKPFSAGLVLGGLALAPLIMVVLNVLVLALGGG